MSWLLQIIYIYIFLIRRRRKILFRPLVGKCFVICRWALNDLGRKSLSRPHCGGILARDLVQIDDNHALFFQVLSLECVESCRLQILQSLHGCVTSLGLKRASVPAKRLVELNAKIKPEESPSGDIPQG